MPVSTALAQQAGLRPYEEQLTRAVENARERDDDRDELTPEEAEEYRILRYCADLYQEARKAREPFENFDLAWDLFVGNTYPSRWPTWRAKITLNRIRALITFLAAVMTDNKPRLSVEPLVPGSEDASDLLRKLVDRDWDENGMQQKLTLFVQHGLIWGTAFMKITYDPYADGGRGRHLATPVVPYRVWTNRTATCIEDAEHLIHTEDMTLGWIRRNFPDKANLAYKYRGAGSIEEKERDRDFIREGALNEQQRIISAQNIDGNITPPQMSDASSRFADADKDTIEVIEYWLRDETLEKAERQKVVRGVAQTEPIVGKDGFYEMETTGHTIALALDGTTYLKPTRKPKTKPVMETYWRPKYPNGRLVLIAAGRILLRDIPNPFQTDGFPWAMWRDYEVGTFWGQGEPIALKDITIGMQRIATEVFSILEKVGNPSYKILKGGGVNANSIRNKPGLLIPMDDIKAIEALEKPPIPSEFFSLYKLLDDAFSAVSGVSPSAMGAMPASNTAFASIDSLQESASAPIRLKVRNMESGMQRIGKLRLALIQQYNARNGMGVLRESNNDMDAPSSESGEGDVVQPARSVDVQFRTYTNQDLQGQVEFGVMPISSLSVSPSGLFQKWMTLYEKHIVDRRWIVNKFRFDGFRTELPRMEKQEALDAAQEAAAKDKSKQKPGPSKKSNSGKQKRGRPAPPAHTTRMGNASVR